MNFTVPAGIAVDAQGRDTAGWRRTAHRVVSLIVVAGYWVAGFGLPSLLTWWQPSDDPAYATGHVEDAALGALLGIVLGGGALLQAWRPLERIAVTQHVLAGGLLAAIVQLVAGRGTDVAGNALVYFLLTGVLAAAHPAKAALVRPSGRVVPAVLAIAVPGAIALGAYALQQGTRQLSLPAGSPASADGNAWLAEIAAAAAAVAVTALIGGLGRAGWRLSAWCAALATTVIAASWIAYPGDAGSPGLIAGVVALVAALLLIAATELSARGR